MPRLILTTNPDRYAQDPSIILDERVDAIHLSTDHAASQLIERLSWAIADADARQGAHDRRPAGRRR
jgi:hypothetical protein